MSIYQWKQRKQNKEAAQKIHRELGLTPMVSRILAARGLDTTEKVVNMVHGQIEIEDPMVLKDMDKAVERIVQALDKGERIAIYGDYDADGVTATSVLYSYLQMCGANVVYFIPTREGDGYALSQAAIDRMLPEKITLIITVDNGISCVEEVDYANQCGIDVVITDHHQPGPVLPNAVAVVDPWRVDCPSTYKPLAGVGVAFKLVCAIEGQPCEVMLDEFAPLVAIGTVADVMPLVGENRAFVTTGLQEMPYTDNVGLMALLNASSKDLSTLDAQTLSFSVVPRINAAGRMGDASIVVELFTAAEEQEAEEIVERLCSLNNSRQEEEAAITEQIDEMAAKHPELFCGRVIVLHSSQWHKGIVGIVSSRIVDKYQKPCILLVDDGEVCKGSGRSFGDFSLFDALQSCSDVLVSFGGHRLAAGVVVERNKIDLLRQRLNEYAQTQFLLMPVPSIDIDTVAEFDELNLDNVHQLNALGPFGNGNSRPCLELEGAQIAGIFPICNNKHVRVKLQKDKQTLFCVCFRMPADTFSFKVGDTVDVAVTLDSYHYLGEENVSIKIKDIHLSGLPGDIYAQIRLFDKLQMGEQLTEEEARQCPMDRSVIALVYKGLMYTKGHCGSFVRFFKLFDGKNINYCQMRLALSILCELGLIQLAGRDNGTLTAKICTGKKVDINASDIYQSYITDRKVTQCICYIGN